MKRMNIQDYEPDFSFRQCVSAINEVSDRDRMLSEIEFFKTAALAYLEHAKAGSAFTIPPLRTARGDDPIVVADIKKSELVKLYEYYMVKREPGRSLYNAILVSAHDVCPLCGLATDVKTLDHYLPKASYPQLSVLPYNLVPACRDCNTDKGNPIITDPAQQHIHPYYDQACFHEDTWIKAEVSHEMPCAIQYKVCPPDEWLEVNKKRASNHFDFFNIARRYRVRAAEDLGTLVDQRRGHMKNLSPEVFREQLRSVAQSQSLPANHWRKVMYRALVDDEWFYSAEL